MKTRNDIFEMICNYYLDCDYTCPRYMKCCDTLNLCVPVRMAMIALQCLESGVY